MTKVGEVGKGDRGALQRREAEAGRESGWGQHDLLWLCEVGTIETDHGLQEGKLPGRPKGLPWVESWSCLLGPSYVTLSKPQHLGVPK